MSQYGKAEYWEERYSKDKESFDWYQRFSGLKEIIMPVVPTESRVLNVGAGNSRLSEEMFDEGFQKITNIDISQTAIKLMSERYKEKGADFKYIQMDVRAMDFHDGSFDAVIDKATLDSILCGEGSTVNANKMVSEVYRVLTGSGVYVLVSYGQPDFRLCYLEKPDFDWTVTVQQVTKPTISASITVASEDKDTPNVHFIYICQRGKRKP